MVHIFHIFYFFSSSEFLTQVVLRFCKSWKRTVSKRISKKSKLMAIGEDREKNRFAIRNRSVNATFFLQRMSDDERGIVWIFDTASFFIFENWETEKTFSSNLIVYISELQKEMSWNDFFHEWKWRSSFGQFSIMTGSLSICLTLHAWLAKDGQSSEKVPMSVFPVSCQNCHAHKNLSGLNLDCTKSPPKKLKTWEKFWTYSQDTPNEPKCLRLW